MDLFGIGPLADLAKSILEMFPNAEQREKAASKLQDFAAQVAAAQSTTNTAEAQTGNLFIAGWRPFIGWTCGIGFAWQIAVPLFHGQPLDTATIDNTLWALLGFGAFRSADKIAGVATTAINLFRKRK